MVSTVYPMKNGEIKSFLVHGFNMFQICVILKQFSEGIPQ